MVRDKVKEREVCEILKELRLQMGYTCKFVADYLQMDGSNYCKYELGKLTFSIHMLKQLCLLYSVSADYILGLKEI